MYLIVNGVAIITMSSGCKIFANTSPADQAANVRFVNVSETVTNEYSAKLLLQPLLPVSPR